MAKCKKCDPHEICEECPEWIFTLADLIMCMMGLFVILWCLKPGGQAQENVTQKQKENQEMIELAGDIRAGFGYVPDPNSSDPVDQAMVKKSLRLVGKGHEGTQKVKQEAVEGTDPTVTTIREGKLSAVGTRILFDRGNATLSSEAQHMLDDIAQQIIGMRFIVVIKGHAARDDFPDGATPQQFMDISIRRAQLAADYLVRRGVSPDILRVQGCSFFEPVRERAYSSELQSTNRRVEVYSTDTLVRDLQDPSRTSSLPMD